jgi:hypothetical protein
MFYLFCGSILLNTAVVLCSLNPIRKEAATMAMCFGWSSPDPRLSAMVELSRGHPCRLLNLSGIGKTLASKGITAEEPPPTLLQIEPARSHGNEELVEAGMRFQPRTRLQTVMAVVLQKNLSSSK